MKDKQLTAVEWLENEIKKIRNIIPKSLFEQAKQMEKEQLVNGKPQIISNCVINEISDEEIENFAEDKTTTLELYQGFLSGAKWYREQLKKK